MKVSLYWPKKSVSTKLETVKLGGLQYSHYPHVYHNGFGLIIKRKGLHHVYCVSGYFIYINGGGRSVEVYAADKGVMCYFKFWAFVKGLFNG